MKNTFIQQVCKKKVAVQIEKFEINNKPFLLNFIYSWKNYFLAFSVL